MNAAATEIMKQAVPLLIDHLKKHLGYMISYKRFENDMRTKMEHLDFARAVEQEHLERNRRNHRVVPDQVRSWLDQVEKIKEKVENFPREDLGCLDLNSRYKLGSEASEIITKINSVLTEHSLIQIQWTDQQIPPGEITDSTLASMIISSDHIDFGSREETFTKALEALGPNHSSNMVALCGMGGLGKTTMMMKLKEAVAKEKLFKYYVEAVIGEKTDPIAVQQAVAEFLGINLTHTMTKQARTAKLRTWFVNNSDGGKNKFLVILDDVWEPVVMEDIGLSRLPNQGVNFKVLITSRNEAVCTEMGVRVDSILKVDFLKEAEAQSLFDQHWVRSDDDVDSEELHKIAENIVKKCHGLPIAIKTMACTLTGKCVDAWKNALDRLQNHEINTVVNAVFETSYVNLRDEVTEVIFLLCGLFPEDFNIPTEELMWYGWGLNLFKGVGTIRQARYKSNTSIQCLIHTNLLIKSDDLYHVGCVKMHDLVRAFVLGMCSEHSIVNHGSNMPGWPAETERVRASCKKISLTCKGMTEFPRDLNFPNLSIIKLKHQDEPLSFPQGFYEGMGKQLQVISYDYMYTMPLFSSQLTSLRVLRLLQCSFEFDDHCSSIGNLVNLEVLSLAECIIESLPISIGKLNKLRVLDVTGCDGHCIDYGVFKNLHRLEELYALASETERISFTGEYNHEVAQRWQNLSSLEYEFFENDAQWKNLSFEKLERFQISVGRSLEGESVIMEINDTFENSLQLVTNKSEVLKSGINKLFKKTVVLFLSVDDMTDLEDVGVIKSSLPPHSSSSFFKLKTLVVSECANLRYLFTPGVAKLLSNLEYLKVINCPVMKQLINAEDRGEETITFPKLKLLSLSELPELLGLCLQNVNMIIELPELVELEIKGIPNITSIYSKNTSETYCLLREKILIPKLKKLFISRMKNLEEIWPCDFGRSEELKLREITVIGCHKLVNLFPCNPMPLLCHLEELEVRDCGYIEVLFNIDNLDCVAAIEKGSMISLRSIEVVNCHKLVDLFSRINPMPSLHHPEKRRVDDQSGSSEALVGDETGEGGSSLSGCYKLVDLFPCLNPMSSLHHPGEGKGGRSLRNMNVTKLGKEVSETRGINKSSVTILKLPNLNRLCIQRCDLLKHIFTFSTLESLIQLEELFIENCKAMKVIVEKTTTASSSSTSKAPAVVKFPRLRKIDLRGLPELVGFFLGTDIEFHWPSLDRVRICDCQRMRVFTAGGSTAPQLKYVLKGFSKYSPECLINSHLTTTTTTTGRLHQKTPCPSLDSSSSSCPAATTSEEINIWSFHNLIKLDMKWDDSVKKIIPSDELLQLQKLRKIKVIFCNVVEEVFEALEAGTNSTTGFDKSQTTTHVKLPNLTKVELYTLPHLRHIWRSNQWTVFEFPNLTTVDINDCKMLKHVFSSSMVGSLGQLQELEISDCENMEEVFVVEEDKESEGKTNEIVFHCLKSLRLDDLPCLKGFCIGKADFSFPILDTLTIKECRAMTSFTTGKSSTLNLKGIKTGFGSFYVEENINSSIKMIQDEGIHQRRI